MWGRRLSFVGVLLVAMVVMQPGEAGADDGERAISIHNIHTKETVTVVFKRNGQFVPESLKKINHVMRDWRRNEPTRMDPALIDLIWGIHRELGSQQPVHLISGYRSGKTNEALRRTRGGQARRSRHITGQAADIHFPDISIKQLRNSALIRERGGVGYYPNSGIPFVHVDTGPVRHWPRLPRQELALLFPSGKSKHVPSDGRPLTKKDFTVALAKLEKQGGELPLAVRRRLKAPTAQPVLASLGPSSLPFGFTDDAPPPPTRSRAAEPAAPASADAGITVTASLVSRNDVFDQRALSAVAEYDDEHLEEIFYQPFPVLPLMTEGPLSSLDMTVDAKVNLARVHALYAAPRRLTQQLQAAPHAIEGYQAQGFTPPQGNGGRVTQDRGQDTGPSRAARLARR